jgi:hypothetical protein
VENGNLRRASVARRRQEKGEGRRQGREGRPEAGLQWTVNGGSKEMGGWRTVGKRWSV